MRVFSREQNLPSPLTPGVRIGPYEVLAPLGSGGMGEVWRARDTRLGRDVALKSLPEGFEHDPGRVGRLEREARLLASLHHTNVATLYGFEVLEGARCLVMECVEGPTLAERLAAGPLAFEEAVEVCRQVAAGLEAAHEQGVVHRDLKPANVKITPAGEVKVLDFGLAKIAAGDASSDLLSSPTLSQAGTAAGVILGTAPYMSPEQARGKPVDRRSDVWSFGCVLFECLTGRRAFDGETVSDVIGRILQTDPDWKALPASTPPRVRELLRRCLTRDPRSRLRDVGEARIALEDVQAGRAEPPATGALAPAAGDRGRERAWRTLAILGLMTSVGLAVLYLRTGPPAPAPSVQATIPLPPGQRVDGFGSPVLALSGDGRTLAFTARGETGLDHLYVRRLADDEATLVPGSETAEGPFFSPDGKWVAFAVGVSLVGSSPPELRKYSLDTGLTQTICALDDYFGGVWRDDGSILFVNAEPRGLYSVDAGGGTPRSVLSRFRDGPTESQKVVAWPRLLPGGREVLLDDDDGGARGRIVAADLETGALEDLGIEGFGARYLPAGYLAYGGTDGALMAVRFDARAVRVTGTPVAVAPGLAFARNLSPAFAVSRNGTLVRAVGYLQGSGREPRTVVRLRRDGTHTSVSTEADLYYGRPTALSPDGRTLALATWDQSIWLVDVSRGTRTKISRGGLTEIIGLRWAPDGSRLAISTARKGMSGYGIFATSVDGAGGLDTLVPVSPSETEGAGWSPDGHAFFYFVRDYAEGKRSSTFFRLDAGAPARALFEVAGIVNTARVSPDGRFVAFGSNTSGSPQISVYPLDGRGGGTTVTSAGGSWPVWSRDGRELYFARGGDVLAVAIDTRDGVRVGPERRLFDWNNAGAFDVGPDGSFYGLEPVPGEGVQTSLLLQTGWFSEVERLAGR
jgi:Tol biopolymer transport system component